MDNHCFKNIVTTFGIGATLGSSIGEGFDREGCHRVDRALKVYIGPVSINSLFDYCTGAVYGTWDSFRFKVSGKQV